MRKENIKTNGSPYFYSQISMSNLKYFESIYDLHLITFKKIKILKSYKLGILLFLDD